MAEGGHPRPVLDGEQEFTFRSVELFKTETLGTGCYGAVCKAKCDELICAAKLLYPIFFQMQAPDPGKEHRQPFCRFELECQFLSRINHPNIVQYLGTYCDPDTNAPALLMELMDESLTHFLESLPGMIPYHIQVNVTYDIAKALAFLHVNGIIHRDLSSNNVLLLSGRAKVTDFGMFKFMDLNMTRLATMTTCPGTPVFMSPEALNEPPVYAEKLDNFSLGVLIVQIITSKFPEPTNRFEVVDIADPRSPSNTVRAQVPISEIKRRQAHISLIDTTHPLLPIALHCLKDKDADRPTAQQLCQTLDALKETPVYEESLHQYNEQHIQAKVDQIRTKHQDMQKEQLEAKQTEIEELTRELNDRTRQLRELNQYQQEVVAQFQQELARNERETRELKSIQHQESIPETNTDTLSSERQINVTVEVSTPTPVRIAAERSCAVIGNKVYFKSHAYLSESNIVYVYDRVSKAWSETEKHPLSSGFSIVCVDNILTTVGGEGFLFRSKKLFCFLYKKWVEIFPPMKVRRHSPGVVYAKRNIVVIGGFHDALTDNPHRCEVEVMNIDTLQWSSVSPLPTDPWYPSVTVRGDHIYVLSVQDTITVSDADFSNESSLYICSIPALLESTKLSVPPFSVWENRQPLPLRESYITTVNGHILAIGGQNLYESGMVFRNISTRAVNSIYEYFPSENLWKVVGEMSMPRSDCIAAVLPDNKLMIVGRADSKDNTVDFIAIN